MCCVLVLLLGIIVYYINDMYVFLCLFYIVSVSIM